MSESAQAVLGNFFSMKMTKLLDYEKFLWIFPRRSESRPNAEFIELADWVS